MSEPKEKIARWRTPGTAHNTMYDQKDSKQTDEQTGERVHRKIKEEQIKK